MDYTKRTRYWLLSMFAIFSLSISAQQKNVLSVPDAKVSIGQAQLPIAIENTDEIVAVQFDLTLPSTISAGTTAISTNRCDGHTIIIRNMSATRYRVMLYSDANKPLLAQQGTVFYIPLNIPATVAEGSELPLVLSSATLSVASGANVLTDTKAGKLIVSSLPDLTVNSVTAESQVVTLGERLTMSWQVKNVGGAATNGGWSEQLLLVNKRGTVTKLMATTYCQETLAAGAVLSRQVDITVPQLLGIEGEAYVQVNVIANSETGESVLATSNNKAQAAEAFTVTKKIFVESNPARLIEGSTYRTMVKVSRSGDWSGEQVFTLSSSADSRISNFPASVNIPAGQSAASVYMTITDNTLLDADSVITITAKGNGYPDGAGRLVIVDNEYPDLTLKTSKSDIAEGETFQLTVTTSRVSTQPITVTITSETAKRFSFPAQVTIPAGETSATINVTATDDDLPSLTLTNAFTASAPNHNKAEAIVVLTDNDLPVLTLTLTPATVQESAGVVAVAGVLRRTTHTGSKITVKLTDDANGGLYFGNRTLTLDKGVEEVHFNFGPVDNATVDGERTYTITAAVWLSSCNCGAAGEAAGSVTAQLKVLDDDGASLGVTSSLSTVKEGGTTTLTVSRNTTDNANPLTVNISSDYDDGLSYSHTVTIPAGQPSATVEVTSTPNSIQGDSHTVVFTVQADGYATGTCYVMVTDQTLPDARINSIAATSITDGTPVTSLEVGAKAKLNITVANDGAAELPAETAVKVYRRGDATAVGTVYTNAAIAVGGTLTVVKTITLPDAVGQHSYYAVVNQDNAVNELTYNNNTSADVTITTTSPFAITVSTDKTVYKQGDKVVISGQLTGSNTADADIDIYLINEGARQVQTAKTDAQGRFSYEWQLYDLQSGHFVAGACYPGEDLKQEMAAFDVYGLRRADNSRITCDVICGDTHTGSFSVANPGQLSLTGCTVEVLSSPATCSAQFSMPATIAADGTALVSYSLKALSPTSENKWEEIKARITSLEGVTLDATLYFYSRTATGKLVANTQSITTTMAKGKTREYSIQVSNSGRGSTGKITLALPEFIKSLAGNTLPALNQNDTLSIPLSFKPTDDMQLNVPVTGQLGINCENGEGLSVSFSITPVSNENGTLLVDVCDEYTYYTNEAPHVAGAEVVVSNPVTNAMVTQGKTNSDGKFMAVLKEGYYKLSVTASNHDTYTKNIYVDPDVTTTQVVNLSAQQITVDWKVEETEMEDEYEITTTVQFETNVPSPVVELIVPKKIDVDSLAVGESIIFNAVLTNKGLITAKDAELILPEGFTHLSFEPLAPYQGLTIVPQQSIFIPVRLTRVSAGSSSVSRRVGHIDNDPCVGQPGTLYFWDCGTDRKWHRYGVAMQLGSCKSDDPSTWNPTYSGPSGGGGGGGWGWGGPGGGGGGWYGPSSNNNQVSKSEDKGCEPCQNQFLLDLVDCGLQLIPAYKVLKAVIQCGKSAFNAYNVLKSDDATGVKKAGAVLSAITTCSSARKAGAGDKNATREKQREEAIESIIETLGSIVGDIAQADSLKEAFNWDSVVENVASLASSISSLAGFDYENLEEMFCPLKLFKPCDKDSVPQNAVRRRADSMEDGYPSYLKDFRRSLSYGLVDMMALTGMKAEVYGNLNWLDVDSDQLADFVVDFSAAQDADGIVSEDKWPTLEANAPEGLKEEEVKAFLKRWNNTMTGADDTNKIDLDKALRYYHAIEVSEEEVIKSGYDGIDECITKEFDVAYDRLTEANSSVCASITLQFKQTMVMTRQAFRGTLTVFNGNEGTPMKNVKMTLTVTNRTTGQVATAHEFQVNAESLKGFTGELDLGSGWTLAAGSEGVATVLFIPTKYAAPDEPVDWAFGGTLTYVDPFSGLEVTRELYPVTLTVKPAPELDLTYFMQRDVYGDDALTLDVVEPMKPAEFALLINNKGNGDATNVRMVTQQPEIIENEKGLLIDFELISSQVNGNEAALSFGQSIANDFGNIPAHSQMYAQWWLTSTLLGHFTEYKVEATHVTSYGNEDLSLLGDVTIHELIHGFDLPAGSLTGGPEKARAFLVNDIVDADDLPDRLYFSNGDTASVAQSTTAQIVRKSSTECELTITPSVKGWNYGNILDPTHGYAELKSIVRKSDGKELGNSRFWQTDRTLRDGKDWLYEYRLHFVDDFTDATAQTYVLTFDPVPNTVLAVESIKTVPAEGNIAEESIDELTVTFNKAVDATTFTGDDLTFAVQGVKKNAHQIAITTEDNRVFKLDMSAMNDTLSNGYYTMTVQTADITDAEGFKGKAGKQVSWTLFRGGLIVLNTAVWPAKAGNIVIDLGASGVSRRADADGTPAESTARYGSDIVFTATPDEGHQFLNWTLNGEVVSTDATYKVKALSDMNVVANFSSVPIKVDIDNDLDGGTIEGAATGIYEHHSTLNLKAVPMDDYTFLHWVVNGQVLDDTSEELTLSADYAMTITAVFFHEYYRQTITLPQGWNWVSSYISEAWPVDGFSSKANRIVGQFNELINDPQFGLVGGLGALTSGVAYKVEANTTFSTTFRGHLYDADQSPISLKQGWNWIAYPHTTSRLIDDVIANAEEGDYLTGQTGFTEYADGYWEGTLRVLTPGSGYLYKSASDKALSFDFTGANTHHAPRRTVVRRASTDASDLMHHYPNTMNVTARVYKDGQPLQSSEWNVYAMAGDELRGIGEFIGNNYYLTVYGDQPVEITFLIESSATGDTYVASEKLTFRDDVVGSRRQPFAITVDHATGITSVPDSDKPMTVYSLEGVLVSQDATLKTLRHLPKGVYIVNGRKLIIK